MLSRLCMMKLSKEKAERKREEKTLCTNNRADRQRKKEKIRDRIKTLYNKKRRMLT